MKKWIVLLAVLMVGCSTAPIKEWSAVNRPKVDTGQMKWSEYYEGLRQQIATHRPDLDYGVQTAEYLRLSALEYEEGHISKADFDAAQDLGKAAIAAGDRQRSVEASQAISQRLRVLQANRPRTTTCTGSGAFINCRQF